MKKSAGAQTARRGGSGRSKNGEREGRRRVMELAGSRRGRRAGRAWPLWAGTSAGVLLSGLSAGHVGHQFFGRVFNRRAERTCAAGDVIGARGAVVQDGLLRRIYHIFDIFIGDDAAFGTGAMGGDGRLRGGQRVDLSGGRLSGPFSGGEVAALTAGIAVKKRFFAGFLPDSSTFVKKCTKISKTIIDKIYCKMRIKFFHFG